MQRAIYSTQTAIAFGATFLLSIAAVIAVLNEHDFSTAVPGMVVVRQGSTVHIAVWLVVLLLLLFALVGLYLCVYDEIVRECAASNRPVACQAQRNNRRFLGFLIFGVASSAVFALLALANIVASRYFLLVLGSLSTPFAVLYFSSTVSYAPLPRLPSLG